jgi:hypothetical protein
MAKARIGRKGVIGNPAGAPLELHDGRERDDELREDALKKEGSSVLPLGKDDPTSPSSGSSSAPGEDELEESEGSA